MRGWLAAASLGLCGCSLILDFGSDVRDAGGDDARVGDAGVDLCAAYEPNNTRDAATPVAPGTYRAGICPGGESDFYSFELDGAQDLIITVTFDNMSGAGDLDLTLYSDSGSIVGSSNNFGNTESISKTLATGRLPQGAYFLEVHGFMRSTSIENTYDFQLVIEPPPGATDAGVPDAGVPDAML